MLSACSCILWNILKVRNSVRCARTEPQRIGAKGVYVDDLVVWLDLVIM